MAISCIEAVNRPGLCQKLAFVDHVIQLVIFAGVGFSSAGHQKTLRNMK